MEYNCDYPNEPIGNGNPYYCCSYCKISDPEINGTIEGHASSCEWRLLQEKKLNAMADFEKWASNNLYGIYRPFTRSKNGAGFINEYTHDCWMAWKAAMGIYGK